MSGGRSSPSAAGQDAMELRTPLERHSVVLAEGKSSDSQASSTEPAATTHGVEDYPRGLKLAAITVGLVLSIFLAALDSTIVATAIPSITDEFGTIRNIAWYGSAYQVTSSSFQSAWGKAFKYFPLKTVFFLAIAVFELGNVVCAVAQDSSIVILGRVIAGLGSGGVTTGAFIIIALTARPRYRPAYMGILGVTYGFASVIGPLLGGVLTDGPGWRWCFWVSLPVGAAAVLMMYTFLSNPTQEQDETSLKSKLFHTDLLGAVLATGALSCFVLAMHWAGTLPWNSASIIGSLAGFGGLTAAFVVNEWLMGPMAMLQSHLLRRRNILLNLSFSFFLAGVFFPLLYLLPVQFQSINNDSASRSGIRLIPLVFGVSVFTMLTNGLLTVWRHYHALLVFSAMVGTAGVAMIYTVDADTSTAAWAGFELVTAAGVGAALQIPLIANQDSVSRDDIPSVISLSLFMEKTGTVLFVAAGEGAFTAGLVSSLQQHVPTLDPMLVVDTGVTQLRAVFSQPAELAGILRAYLEGFKVSHTISVACGVATAIVSFISAWPSGMRMLRTRLDKPHLP